MFNSFHVLSKKKINFGPPTHAMLRPLPPYVQLFFTTLHTHLLSLEEGEKSLFFTDSAILIGVYQQILDQLGNRPLTGCLSCLRFLLEYVLDNGRDPLATFSESNLCSYMPNYEMSVEPLSNITQVRDIVVFQQQLQMAIDFCHFQFHRREHCHFEPFTFALKCMLMVQVISDGHDGAIRY